MQITDLEKEQKITPFLRLGFRPFFSLGALFSVVSILLWALTLSGSISINFYGGSVFWHIHEMVFGFVCAIIVGFLLTAVQNWTGQRGLSGKPLLLLITIWLCGRLVMLFPDILGDVTSSIIDLLFLPLAALFLAVPIIKVKQNRNLFFVPLLLLFAITNLSMHMSVLMPESGSMKGAAYTVVMLVTFLMSVMSGRVTPMFTANGTQTVKVTPIAWLDNLANGSILVLAISYLIEPIFVLPSVGKGILFLVAGMLQLVRWLRWKPWITLQVPLLWSLHASLMFICFGLLMLGIGYLSNQLPLNHLWHLLTIGGMGGLILAMISRVSLGHTGRVLSTNKIMSFAFLLLFASAIIRSFGAWLFPALYLEMINASVVCWVIGYGIFIIRYTPWLLSARKDGRPG